MKSNKLIAFAEDFVSFVLENIELSKIRNIILFGSVARGEASRNSDVDIFFDTNFNLNKKLNDLKDNFYDSVKYKNYWELMEVKNEISLNVGNLNKWDLKSSVIANGIVLYGPYKEMPEKVKHKVLFVWENVKPESSRVMLNKKIFGYTHGGKFYKGILELYGGVKLGKGSIMVPIEYSKKFKDVLKKYGANAKIKKVMEY